MYIAHGATSSNSTNYSESWQPKFSWHGFRYVKVEGCPVVGDGGSGEQLDAAWRCDVRAVRVGSELPRDASVVFGGPSSPSSAAALLNSIFTVVDRTMRSNNIGFQTSCPQREKVAWTGDTLATAPTRRPNS